ncbi:MAG TPA: DNA translocase FtsK [Clostridiales bacterium]|nr:DNA translocase FtsK [Clostridiales bacterium]
MSKSGSTGNKKSPKSSGQSKANENKQTKVIKNSDDNKLNSRQKAAIICFAVSILLFFLAFIKGRFVWEFFHNSFISLFGYITYLVPFTFLYAAVMLAFEKNKVNIWGLVLQPLGVISFLSGLLHLIGNNAQSLEGDSIIMQVTDAWDKGIVSLNAGSYGALLGGSFAILFGRTASLAILAVALFVVVMFLLKLSLSTLFNTAYKPIKAVSKYVENIKAESNKENDDSEEDFAEEENIEPYINNMEGYTDKKSENPLGLPRDPVEIKNNEVPSFIDVDEGSVPVKKNSSNPKSDFDDTELFWTGEGYDVEIFAPGLRSSLNDKEDPVFINLEDSQDNKLSRTKKAKPKKEETTFIQDDLQEDIDNAQTSETYKLPPHSLLTPPPANRRTSSQEELNANSQKLEETLKSFNVEAKVVAISKGPSVTRYELQPRQGTRINRITPLANDIALSLAAASVRIEAPIPNKSAIGIEIPNKVRENVYFREMVESEAFQSSKSKLTMALGKDISGKEICMDLEKMPHLLIAGTTGSGKSVCMNSLIQSILFNASPDEVKLILIDVKGGVELGAYNGIDHLIMPVVTEARNAAGALNWAVKETSKRYKIFELNKVKNIAGYNELADKTKEFDKLYRIVIFIDELNDLMMVAPNEVEDAICRIAQLARAAGIHLVVATQRPSVDVITGVIKANIPSRIALSVASQVDSRTILDTGGAEKLLGHGDMLFNPVGTTKPTRVQGCFVSDKDIEKTVEYLRSVSPAHYDDGIINEITSLAVEVKKKGVTVSIGEDREDELLPKAIEQVVRAQKASTTFLQRKLQIGYARAANIVDTLEQMGVVSTAEGNKPREVLMSLQDWQERYALAGDDDFSDDDE